MTDSPPKLRGVSDLREFFRTNTEPIEDICNFLLSSREVTAWMRGTPIVRQHPDPVTPTSFKMA